MIDTKKEQLETNKLHKRLRREVGLAITDFNMIEAGDKVMVCMSGGKDSYTLLDILRNLKHNAPISFDIVAMHLDQKQPGYPAGVMADYFEKEGIDHHIVEQDTYSIVKRVVPEGKTTCGLCSRLRRGIIYTFAKKIGATKVALGHHREDIIETFFLNLFFGGRLKAMPPKLRSDDGEHILIRPLAYCSEADLMDYADFKKFPIIPCNLCGSQENLQRRHIKQMLSEWDKVHPGRVENIFRSLQNVSSSHLVDRTLFDFQHL